MNRENLFLSCDWGTSAFRLRLVSVPDLAILAEESSKEGAAIVYKAWNESGAGKEKRIPFYRHVLNTALSKLEAATDNGLDGLPLIISGMASSTLGMMELPYGPTPFSLDGADLVVTSIPASADFPHEILLVSGVRYEDDVMRGEEVQVVGCLLPQTDEPQIIIHPGTHTKHIMVEGHRAMSFRTFMSGEMFSLLSKHSILAASVEHNSHFDHRVNKKSFEEGIRLGVEGSFLHHIFSVRTGDLFRRRSRQAAHHYLSGIIIGSELSAFPKDFRGRVILAGEPALVAQYSLAIDVLGIRARASSVTEKDAVSITLAGHYQMYRRHCLKD